MENLGTIQFLVETVERLTKEGTTYKVELEHTNLSHHYPFMCWRF